MNNTSIKNFFFIKKRKKVYRDFPGGPVVKNLLSKAGETDSIPGWGTKIPHAREQLNPHAC